MTVTVADCGLTCPIRQCAREKEVESCAHCLEFPCAKLEALFRTEPTAKRRLDAIRKQR